MNLSRVATAVILVGCTGNGTSDKPPATPNRRVDSSRTPDSATAWAVGPTKNYLNCSPTTVGPDSALTLRMQRPHGASLYIGAPDGTLYLIVFHGEGKPDRAARRSLMPPDAFAGLSELRLKVGTLMGGAWTFGRDTNEVVFRAPGAYRIRVGDDMETDGPVYAECTVTFEPRK